MSGKLLILLVNYYLEDAPAYASVPPRGLLEKCLDVMSLPVTSTTPILNDLM